MVLRPMCRLRAGAHQVLGDGSPSQVQMTSDLAHRPVLGPVQAMNFVDLFGAQHGAEFGYTGRPAKTR